MIEPVSSEALLGPLLTLEEWAYLPDEVPGEFVDGRLVEEEVPDYLHEVLIAWLLRMLGNWGESRGAIVGGSGAKFAVADTRGRKPDLTAYLGRRRPEMRGLVRVVPDIAVEVISSTPRDERRDRQEKMAEYASFGVRYYWLLDPKRRSFEIYQLRERGSYEAVLVQNGGAIAAVPGCDGLSLDLDALWSQIAESADE